MLTAVKKPTRQKNHLIQLFKNIGRLLSPFLSVLLINIAFPVKANDISYSSSIYSITQDDAGFMWFAGQHGLQRFDGNEKSTILFSNTSKNWPLPFNWISSMVLEGNTLYLGAESNGIWAFNIATGDIEPINNEHNIHQIRYLVSYQQHLYYAANNQVHVVDVNSKETKSIGEFSNINAISIANDTLFISSADETVLININQPQLKQTLPIAAKHSIRVNDYVILVNGSQLSRVDPQGKVTTLDLDIVIQNITQETATNNVLLSTIDGDIVRVTTDSLTVLPDNFITPDKFRAMALFHDKSSLLWASTSQGIKRIVESPQIMHSAIFDVSINVIKAELFDKSIWLGSYGQGLAKLINGKPVLQSKFNQGLTPKGLIITDLKQVDNKLFISSFDGVWWLDNQYETINKLPIDIQGDIVLALESDATHLYLSTDSDGLYIVDRKSLATIKHINAETLKSSEVIDTISVGENHIWIATSDGINVYNLAEDEIFNIDLPSNHKAISLASVNQKIYCATKGDGVFVFDSDRNLIDHVAAGEDISDIKFIDGILWLASRPGLYRLDTTTNIRTLVPNTQHYSFTDEVMMYNGNIVAANFAGLLELKTHASKQYNPKIVIGDTIVSGQHFINKTAIELNSSNDVVDFRLASMDFRPGQPKQFKFRINGGSWTTLSSPQLTLTGLKSGNYNIEIKGTNSLGQWSDFTAFASIKVKFPWFWTPEIRIFYTVALVCIVFVFIWLTTLRARSIQYIYAQLEAEKRIKGDPLYKTIHRLQLIKSALEESPSNILLAKQLTEQCIDKLSDTTDQKIPDTLHSNSLTKSIPYLSDYLNKEYLVQLTVDLNFDEEKLPIELQKDIYSIIFEAINSAVNTGDSNNFDLSLTEVRDKLWLKIKDDNNCFSNYNSRINFTMSMYFIRKVAVLHNALVDTYDDAIEGSYIAISFPLHHHDRLNNDN